MQTREIVYIDSSGGEPGTETDFIFPLAPRSDTFDRVSVLSVTIPRTYYLIDEQSRSLTLIEDGKEVKVTIEAGDYDYKSFNADDACAQ